MAKLSLPLTSMLGTLACLFLGYCKNSKTGEPLPEKLKMNGAFIKTLPYFNPDSCTLLIKKDISPKWQGAAYENLFLGGPENSSLELGFKHLDNYEKNFPADSARAFAQRWRGQLLIYSNKLDSAKTCLQESANLYDNLNNPLMAIEVQSALGEVYAQEGKTNLSLPIFLSAYYKLKLFDDRYKRLKVGAIRRVNHAYFQSRNFQEALSWINLGIKSLENETDESLMSDKSELFHEAGVVYTHLKQPDSAILMIQKSLELHEKYKFLGNRPSLLADIGTAFLAKGDCRAALKFLLEATNSLPKDMAYLRDRKLVELGKSYKCLNKIDSAEAYFKLALGSPNPTDVSAAQTGLAEIYSQKGAYKQAWEAIQASLQYREKLFNQEKVMELGAMASKLELDLTQQKLLQSKIEKENLHQRGRVIGLSLLLVALFSVSFYFRLRSNQRALIQQNLILEQEKMLKDKAIELANTRDLLRTHELQLAKDNLQHTEKTLKTTEARLDDTIKLLDIKNKFIEEMKMLIQQNAQALGDYAQGDGQTNAGDFRAMKILTKEDWSHFKDRFQMHFPGFLTALGNAFPQLTVAEVRLFMLTKLGFFNREIAESLGISLESVHRSRNRLRKKLGLPETGDLDAFVRQFS